MINLTAISKPPVCKHCGFILILGGTYKDQLAQEEGFCKSICRSLYNSEKDFILEREATR